MVDEPQVRVALEGATKLVLNARLVALLLTVLWLPSADPTRLQLLTALLAVTGASSVVPILLWERTSGWLLRHPVWMTADVLVAMVVMAMVGLDTPFGLVVLTTAVISGLLYGWVGAASMSLALFGAYLGGAMLGAQSTSLGELLGIPALVPVSAAAGAAVRALVIRQHEASRALAESAMTVAAGTERTRLAREMHDTLAKTLHGIGLSATALPRLLQHDPSAAASVAEQLASTAQRAATEARSLIVDLRSDDLERPLDETLRVALEDWAARTGCTTELELEGCLNLSPSVRYELFCIVREALRNADEHGEATHIQVALRALEGDARPDDGNVELLVTDDGRGFTVPGDLGAFGDAGHFGVVGMQERAASIGGRCTVTSSPGAGARIRVVAPRAADGEQLGQLPPMSGSAEERT